jgi:hypothetical protein
MAENLIRLKQINQADLSGYISSVSQAALMVPNNQILNTTYSTLTGLKATGGLLSGQLYRISDFILKWNNQSINDRTVKTGISGEPLIVTALSNDKIYHIAQSQAYPQDTIYYDINATGSYSWGTINNNKAIPDFKGWIYRRIDNLLDIDMPYDWRNITVNCCKPNVISVPNYSSNTTYRRELDFVKETGDNANRGKLYYSIVAGNIGNALTNTNFWRPVSDFVESGTYFATDESVYFQALAVPAGFKISLPFLTTSRIQQPIFTSTLTGSGDFILNNVKHIKVEDGYNNVIVGNDIYSNKIGSNFSNNTINSGFNRNTIANDFFGNNIGTKFYLNVIGNYFYWNTIRDNFYLNTVGNSFLQNAVGSTFNSNTTRDVFGWNIIGDNFYYNTNEKNFTYNVIGDYFYFNTISNYFGYNTIGNAFIYNAIGNNFSNNTIKNNFQSNISENNFNYISFSNATHVYADYNTILFRNAANTLRLRYFNSSDQLVVTDPTS